jgi:hypothetical protein
VLRGDRVLTVVAAEVQVDVVARGDLPKRSEPDRCIEAEDLGQPRG